MRSEGGFDALFLAVVNIVSLQSSLLLESAAESGLALAAFGGRMLTQRVMDLGSRVSRKKEFVPPLTKAITGGLWKKPERVMTRRGACARLDPAPSE